MSADDELVDHWRTRRVSVSQPDVAPGVRGAEISPAGRAPEAAVVGARLGSARRHLVRRPRRGRQRWRRSSASWNISTRAARAWSRSRSRHRVEQGQWYFQRYVQHLPTRGEIVLFDRSWYNRAGVERVMGFCTDDEVVEFLRQAPEFERNLTRSGVHLIKFWFSVSREEQRRRFRERERHPLKQWKLSPVDIASLDKWDEYTGRQAGDVPAHRRRRGTVDRDQVRLQEAGSPQRDPLRPAQASVRPGRTSRTSVRSIRSSSAGPTTCTRPKNASTDRVPNSKSPAALRRRGVRLEWATNIWNATEVFVTVSLGVRAGSLALIAFGLDSIIEIFASTVVIREPARRPPRPR